MLDGIKAKRHKVQQLMFDIPPPDLSTKAGRKAWRHEMRMVAVRPRRWGLWLLTLGFLLVMAPAAFGIHSIGGWSPSLIGSLLMLAALPLLIAGALLRRRYRQGRMVPFRAEYPGKG
jgi:hypothetical protein